MKAAARTSACGDAGMRAAHHECPPHPCPPDQVEDVARRLSVAVVVVVVLMVRVLSSLGVLEMTPVAIGIAHPSAWATVNFIPAVFRLAPTSVSVVIALDPHAVIAVCVAALVSVRKRERGNGRQCNRRKYYVCTVNHVRLRDVNNRRCNDLAW
jgi:hypothetical protein